MADPGAGPVLTFDSIEVGGSRLEACVRVADGRYERTSSAPGLAERASRLLPGLARHTCRNPAGDRALREFADTETPHLLEHVAVELMALAGSPRSLQAETSWDFTQDGPGVYRVRLEYDDDLVALGALREAAGIVEWLLKCGAAAEAESAPPDVGGIVERLRRVRRSR